MKALQSKNAIWHRMFRTREFRANQKGTVQTNDGAVVAAVVVIVVVAARSRV